MSALVLVALGILAIVLVRRTDAGAIDTPPPSSDTMPDLSGVRWPQLKLVAILAAVLFVLAIPTIVLVLWEIAQMPQQ